eukprot:CAMPEP_0175446468 /NCGR_PEP_ID=MMETSP0095-20121207/60294_1 /TAXON_ID=311494 /ORGANISM="Alexandrium monilatum, Strain CCMP3105" /LENGTH=279 /DNA_ID=CAMNT_0016746759 /DNA_START=1 /DNA_END=839 /DNA_ORIENTATION=+
MVIMSTGIFMIQAVDSAERQEAVLRRLLQQPPRNEGTPPEGFAQRRGASRAWAEGASGDGRCTPLACPPSWDAWVLYVLVPRWPQEATTAVLKNLPSSLTRETLMQNFALNGFVDNYDFLHLPRDFKSKRAMGYAIVNFRQHGDAERFACTYHACAYSGKWLKVEAATLQGFLQNVAGFLGRRRRWTRDEANLPVIFPSPSGGGRPLKASELPEVVAEKLPAKLREHLQRSQGGWQTGSTGNSTMPARAASQAGSSAVQAAPIHGGEATPLRFCSTPEP